ncbi:helix-turn-helix domain-containing protein [Azohydromonas sediminis]|uniref:helix-turn-helix domain-containing protein n=1 Tax=Azohydromonas sediminis TaxID=2259674 RepID=UPI000E65DF6A|nr:helix-turn-helix domain-containing protein [Azohydromonas sediminis]
MEDTIGFRLKQWRAALGLTQAQLAERIGVHIGVLKKYEQGLNVPGGEALTAIARTGVDMRWLLTGEGEMLPKPAPDKAFEDVPYARRLEKIGLLLGGMTEQEASAFLDEMFARAQSAADAHELRRALNDLRAQVERLTKSA